MLCLDRLLSLGSNKLTGTLPSSMSVLAALTYVSKQQRRGRCSVCSVVKVYNWCTSRCWMCRSFSAPLNNLTGSVPDLSASAGLAVLDLSNNRLSSAFPSFITNLVQLTYV